LKLKAIDIHTSFIPGLIRLPEFAIPLGDVVPNSACVGAVRTSTEIPFTPFDFQTREEFESNFVPTGLKSNCSVL
jgi:hypothetical protein